METKRYEVIPGLVELSTNVREIQDFSYAPVLHSISPPSEGCLIRVQFKVGYPFASGGAQSSLTPISPFFFRDESDDAIYRLVSLLGGVKVKIMLKNLRAEPILCVNRVAFNLLKWPVRGLFTPGMNLTNVVFTKLLELGYLTIHSCCVASKDAGGLLILAPSETGKTMTVFSLLGEGFTFLSEDLIITDGKYAYSCPFTSTYFHNDFIVNQLQGLGLLNKRDLIKLSFSRFLQKVPALVSLFNPSPDPVKIMSGWRRENRAEINSIFMLRKGAANRLRKADKNTMVQEIEFLNRLEFWNFGDPLLLHYSHCNPSFQLRELINREYEIVQSMVGKADCYIVECVNALDFHKMIKQAL